MAVLKHTLAALLVMLASGLPAAVQAQFDDEPLPGAVYGRDTETAEEGEDGGDEPKAPAKPRVIDLEQMRKGYRLRAEDPSTIPAFVAPKLPDLTPYTVKNLEGRDRRKIGRAHV